MRNKNVLLKSILEGAGIASGYSFRSKVEDDPAGELRVVQLKDFIDNYTAIGDECFKVSSDGIKEKYLLRTGDILFISKGQNNNAVAFLENDEGLPYVASSALFVITVDQRIANPFYVAWYINQLPVQSYIKQNLTGTYTPTVNRKVVENISIKLPSLDEQAKIAALAGLTLKEKKIREELLLKRELLINNQLLKHINKNR